MAGQPNARRANPAACAGNGHKLWFRTCFFDAVGNGLRHHFGIASA